MSDPATVILNLGEEEMTTDLPDGVLTTLLKTGSEAYQRTMADQNDNGATAHNLARLGAIERFNELGTVEGRANSGVMATPIASPTTQV